MKRGVHADPDGAALHALSPIEPRSAAQHVLLNLIDAIRAGVFDESRRLPTLRNLSAHLNASQVVVREALTVLESAGIIRARRGRKGGYFLQSLDGIPVALASLFTAASETETAALIDARIVLERAVAEHVCRSPDPERVSGLDQIVDALRGSAEDPAGFVELTVRFHLKLAANSGNPFLSQFLRELVNRMAITGLMHVTDWLTSERLSQAVAVYGDLYQAIVDRDSKRMHEAIAEHERLLYTVHGIAQPDSVGAASV